MVYNQIIQVHIKALSSMITPLTLGLQTISKHQEILQHLYKSPDNRGKCAFKPPTFQRNNLLNSEIHEGKSIYLMAISATKYTATQGLQMKHLSFQQCFVHLKLWDVIGWKK